MGKKITNIIQIVLAAIMVLIILLCAMFIINTLTHKDEPSKIFGFYIFELSGDSMRPEYKKGDLVFVKAPKDGVYMTDMVVTYKSKDGATITHKIVKIEGDLITCRGTSENNTTDDAPITADMIYGQVRGAWAGFGNVKSFVTSPWGILAILLYGVLIFEGIPFIAKKLFGKE